MELSELPQRIADRAKTKRRAGDRRALRVEALTTAKLIRVIAAEQAKRAVNRARASGSSKAGQ